MTFPALLLEQPEVLDESPGMKPQFTPVLPRLVSGFKARHTAILSGSDALPDMTNTTVTPAHMAGLKMKLAPLLHR